MNPVLSSDDESLDEEEVLRDFDAEAKLIIQTETLPQKSADRYNLVYETYKTWQNENKNSLSTSHETNLIVYFKKLSEKLKPTTLWSIWSMLKKTLNTRENVDISGFQNLKSIIKNNSKGYKPKKSLVLKWEEIMQFINKTSDYSYLASKVILIFGICGALRCDEITNLKVQDVEDLGNKYLISINETKNDKPRQFIIGQLFYGTVKKYIDLRPSEQFTNRLFIQYHKGKCHHQVIGRNKIGETPQIIASVLNLPNAKLYTGHCFRRTGATLLSDSGANVTMLKQLGGWKSTEIAQGYVENSIKNKEQIFQNITHAVSATQSMPSVNENCLTESIIGNKDNKSTNTKENFNNFFDDFDVTEEELTAIDQLNQSKEPEISAPYFTTAKNRKILMPCSNNLKVAEHFTSKSPIKVSFNASRDEPLQKKSKNLEGKAHAKKQTLQSPSDPEGEKNDDLNSVFKKNSFIKYENCVFHGNITNNFYCSSKDSS